MKVYTCQISKHRKVTELSIPFKDITVKSGDKVFAPTWEILMEYKNGGGEDLYTSKFIPLMRQSYQHNKSAWLELCKMEEVCLACYCKAGDFCHRHIIVDMLEKVCKDNGIEFERMGGNNMNLLDVSEKECWSLICENHSNGDDCSIGWVVVGYFMDKPYERVIG